MAKFLYSAAMSLDGLMAGSEDDMSSMTRLSGPNPVVDDLISSATTPYEGQEGEGEAFGGRRVTA